ncbi:MAG: site-2 protease family protein, partial [Nanoarchaeota archaeon]|nr:site-2 protease family protein [Nanoarchaeota archaeon]
MFKKKEIFYLVISIIVMGLALGFDDGAEVFNFGFWITNMFWIMVMVGFSFTLHQLAHKWVAKIHGFQTEYQFWGI